MKHVELFENFEMKNPLYVIDLKEEFPDVYDQPSEIDPNDPDNDYYGEGEAKLKVYEFTGDSPDTKNEFSTVVDPSFHDGKYKLKLEVETVDQLHYGNTNVIYIGIDNLSKESVIAWFSELLNDSSRDYLSY
jgi:hypothetical protein